MNIPIEISSKASGDSSKWGDVYLGRSPSQKGLYQLVRRGCAEDVAFLPNGLFGNLILSCIQTYNSLFLLPQCSLCLKWFVKFYVRVQLGIRSCTTPLTPLIKGGTRGRN